jgi:DNA-binding beta-propeller fold protein YncE
VGTIALPGDPITDLGVMVIDQASGLGYLGDKVNKSVVVFDTKTDKFVSRIPGFVGLVKNGNNAGPNGLVVVKGGAELWVSDGDSTIKLVDLKTNNIVETIATGGKARANAMAVTADGGIVLVANSNDEPPYLSFISTQPGHKVLGKVAIPESGENLERSAYHAPSGTFFTVIPVSRADDTKGLLAQTDPKNGKMVKLHEIERCHPHSLAIVSDSTIFLGCSSAHGPASKPGGDLAIFDIPTGKVEGYAAGYGGNGSSATNPNLGQYYHATTGGALMVVDTKTKQPVQKLTTSNGARSVGVSLANNRVYVATTAKDTPCVGCIVVFASE